MFPSWTLEGRSVFFSVWSLLSRPMLFPLYFSVVILAGCGGDCSELGAWSSLESSFHRFCKQGEHISNIPLTLRVFGDHSVRRHLEQRSRLRELSDQEKKELLDNVFKEVHITSLEARQLSLDKWPPKPIPTIFRMSKRTFYKDTGKPRNGGRNWRNLQSLKKKKKNLGLFTPKLQSTSWFILCPSAQKTYCLITKKFTFFLRSSLK